MWRMSRRGHAPVPAAGETDADSLLVQVVTVPSEDALVEVHEITHLVRRPPPVLRGEGEHREPAHAELERSVDGVEHRLLAGGVTFGARQAALACPAAVAVHHACHVPRDTCGIVIHAGHYNEVTPAASR